MTHRFSPETVASVSARAATPMPADLDEALAARTALHDKVVTSALAQPDPDVDGVFRAAESEVRRVSAPYRERLTAIEEDRGLNAMGATQRKEALTQALAAELETQVFGPLSRRVEMVAQRYAADVQPEKVTDEARAAAVVLASELRLLSAPRALARVAEVVRDAARSDNFGVVRASIPFLRSMIEEKGSAWYGSEDLYPLVERAENETRTWKQDIAEWRLYEIQQLQWQLGEIRTAALEEAGDIDKSMRFRMSDFKTGTLRTPNPTWPGMPGHARLQRAQAAAGQAYVDASRGQHDKRFGGQS